MSESAFGVDHGDVEKAFTLPKVKMPKMPGDFMGTAKNAKPMGMQATRGMGSKIGQGTMGAGSRMGMMGAGRAGAGVTRAGAGMMKRPGITGGAALGAGAAGGATAYGMKRKKTPRPGQV